MRPSRPRLALIGGAVGVLIAVGLLGMLRQRDSASAAAAAALLIAAPLPATVGVAPTTAEVVSAWQQAGPLNVPLAGGVATSIQVSAVYSAQAVYFRLHWPEALNNVPAPTVQQQQATVTWKRNEAIGGCAVVCHVSFSAGRWIDNMQVVAPDVTAAPFTVILDQWQDGWWTLGYSRPLVTPDVEDIQFSDLRRAYPFGLDIAEGAGSSHTHGEALTLRFAAG